MFIAVTYWVLSLQNTEGRPSCKCILYGPVLADIDQITEGVLPELKVGEWVYFENSGAYSRNLHCEFLGFKKPPLHYVLEEKDRYIPIIMWPLS